MDADERLAVFLDYENLALGAREHLGGMAFDFGPIADALAVRGRAVVRRAYADWSFFSEDRRALTRHQVELIEMPQHMGASRKNAADIKMVVDVIEMALEREYISTFVMCTGDSDFTPLVHKLRELNKRVIGVGVENSTSRLLPPACDEFLFYDRLEGVDVPDEPAPTRSRGRRSAGHRAAGPASAAPSGASAATGAPSPETGPATGATPAVDAAAARAADEEATARAADEQAADEEAADETPTLEVRIAQTLGDLESSTGGAVTASLLKRTLLRKDPTFTEADYGFRAFGELLRHLAAAGVVELQAGPAAGDPEVSLPEQGDRQQAFALLRAVVADAGGSAAMSGLKNRLRKARPAFSEKALGFRGFLPFVNAAADAGVVTLTWDDAADDYLVAVAA